jgi:hypothetical protein
MKRAPRAVPALLAVFLLHAAPAVAKTISIAVTPTAQLQEGVLTVRVTVSNSGDEAAESVTPVLRFRDQETRGQGRPSLGPGQSLAETLSLPAAALGPGRWPYGVAVDYTDANQYPFQALQVGTVVVGNLPPAKLAVPEIKAPGLARSVNVHIRLKNLAGQERKAALAVMVPEGIEVTGAPPTVTLAAWEEKVVSVPLVNRTAREGSRLPIFVTAQFDDGAIHQAVVAQGMVAILAAQSFFGTRQRLFWIGAGALVIGWSALVLWRLGVRRGEGRALEGPR